MDFHYFMNCVPKIAKEKLLGKFAHAKMAPLERLKWLEEMDLKAHHPRKAAVMMLFYPKNNQTHLALIIRNSGPSVHASQIAFPGGKAEPEDLNLAETALRETHEEIGISPNQIEIIRPFTEIYIPPSNFLVSPFLGISKTTLSFQLQASEVAGIIELPLSMLMSEQILKTSLIKTSYAESIQVPIFEVFEHQIWGATAMMLNELKECVKKSS
jgi:8-oxo-dGTP pyrophosphatase MutT (NUDIX family)